MNIIFLDFCLTIVALYLISQILIPAIFPSKFDRNWLFKKKHHIDESLEKKVEQLSSIKKTYDEEKEKVEMETKRKANEAKDLKNKASHL